MLRISWPWLGAALLLGVAPVSAQPAAPDSVWIAGYRDGGFVDGGFVHLRWTGVEEAVEYRIWTEALDYYRLDADGNLVELEEPRLVPVPLGKVGAVDEAVVANLRVDGARYGVSAIDAAGFSSEIRWTLDILTGARRASWGQIKRRVP